MPQRLTSSFIALKAYPALPQLPPGPRRNLAFRWLTLQVKVLTKRTLGFSACCAEFRKVKAGAKVPVVKPWAYSPKT